MRKIERREIFSLLEDEGFHRDSERRHVFLLEDKGICSRAYIPVVLSKSGRKRLGGMVGMFFPEFENAWIKTLTRNEKAVDKTLPFVSDMGNFTKYLDNNIWSYHSELFELKSSVKSVLQFCELWPKSFDEFRVYAQNQEFLEKNISFFLHIKPIYSLDNILFRKSANFLKWGMEKYPIIFQCIVNSFDRNKSELYNTFLQSSYSLNL